MHQPLRGRRDYICDYASTEDQKYTCKTCPVPDSDSETCHECGCIYWRDKEAAMANQIATLTFAYLIIDNYIPPYADNEAQRLDQSSTEFKSGTPSNPPSDMEERQISFSNRDLLIIDEAHTLEEQVASLQAGFKLSVKNLAVKSLSDFDSTDKTQLGAAGDTVDVYEVFSDGIENLLAYPSITVDSIAMDIIEELLADLHKALVKKATALKTVTPSNKKDREQLNKITDDLKSVARSIEMIFTDREESTPWVIEVTSDTIEENGDKKERYGAKLKPVYVGTFLQRFVWSRADKVVLSTATMPYRSDPGKWIDRIGLDPSTTGTISRPMPFPAENRPIDTTTTVDSFSSGGVERSLR